MKLAPLSPLRPSIPESKTGYDYHFSALQKLKYSITVSLKRTVKCLMSLMTKKSLEQKKRLKLNRNNNNVNVVNVVPPYRCVSHDGGEGIPESCTSFINLIN